ncbi:MAG: hypothetical protein ACRDSN_20210, partial [Pseudonocardiaceae bacterium]
MTGRHEEPPSRPEAQWHPPGHESQPQAAPPATTQAPGVPLGAWGFPTDDPASGAPPHPVAPAPAVPQPVGLAGTPTPAAPPPQADHPHGY